ncbi:MAG TPA: hypothetical protein VMW35_16720 [Myxococcota bacterium]|jgi:uncharacterized protein YdiU (UPF0061 family)|nr:hypothetical protein [Myxococcota bacterium]
MSHRRQPHERLYRRFRVLDGRHPLKRTVPNAYVEYPARRRSGGAVAYFNFTLAKEMGLLPARHPSRLGSALERVVLETFGLQIINEWDQLHGPPVPADEVLPHTYMATRYLQLQHPDRRGASSGDGRSIWNGCVTHRGVTWDVSSCGTGVTRLCPATAEEKRFFKTGNRYASYGCGTAALAEGISAALMSEIFHRNGIATERVLAVIEYPGGFAVNVRAAPNLLRPSHFFVHLKRGDLASLGALVELFVERQLANGAWPKLPRRRRLAFLAEEMARTFARAAATFESEYVFCWLDWDGDNVLASGGIIDYGSVRQFGLYHREYRFDDGPRWSTTIPEQRRKARYIVQNFVQIRDALETGRKRPLAAFRHDPALRLFDEEFERTKNRLLLRKIGFPPALEAVLLERALPELLRYRRVHEQFERARSSRGPVKVADGLSWNAVYCVRDLLRELPAHFARETRWLEADELLAIACSTYASRRDRQVTPARARRARALQRAYIELVRAASAHTGVPVPHVLAELARRAAVINRPDRITGDAIDHATARILRRRRRLSRVAMHALLERFIERQDLRPLSASAWTNEPPPPPSSKLRRLLEGLSTLVRDFREGL